MNYSNAHKLSVVLSDWLRPAIAQIASTKLCSIPFMQSLQTTIIGSGLVGNNYHLADDVQPLVAPAIDALIEPMAEQYLSQLPDSSIPQMAHNILCEMEKKGSFSFMQDLIILDAEDIHELKELVQKNLPIHKAEEYQILK